jgi:hypothetical protein
MATACEVEFALVLTEEERGVLSSLLKESLVETHVEKRRTEAPRYRDQVRHQEAVIRSLIEKVSRLRP